MIRSLWSAASGMLAQQMNVDTISNNLANVNTPGFKKSRVEFEDLLYQVIRPPQQVGTGQGTRTLAGLDVGLGVRPVATLRQFSPGNLQPTDNPNDFAVRGDGFFIVTDGTSKFYARAGNFGLDGQGNLTTPEGYKVLGASGSPIRIDLSQTMAAKATTKVTLGGVLSSNTPIQPDPGSTFDLAFGVTDSRGGPQSITLTFTHTAANTWTVANGTATATVTIDATTGKPTGTTSLSVTYTPSYTGATAQTVAFDLSQIVSNAAPTDLNVASQDGAQAGKVGGYAVGPDGTVTLAFTNGQTQDVAQIGLANFSNPAGLSAVGQNLYQQTAASGTAQTGKPGSSQFGTLAQSVLETSNVQVVEEMVNLIVAQRAYEISSKAVQSSDEMLGIANGLRR